MKQQHRRVWEFTPSEFKVIDVCCPTIAGRGRWRGRVHLWSRRVDEMRRQKGKGRKRRHRSTDLWSECSPPVGQLEKKGRAEEEIHPMETSIWNSPNSGRTLPLIKPRKNVFTLTLYMNTAFCRCLTDFSWSRQMGGTQRGVRRSCICWVTVSEIFPWQRRTDLVIDKKLRRHWKEAKGINSWEEVSSQSRGQSGKTQFVSAESVLAHELTSHQSVDQPRVITAKENKMLCIDQFLPGQMWSI